MKISLVLEDPFFIRTQKRFTNDQKNHKTLLRAENIDSCRGRVGFPGGAGDLANETHDYIILLKVKHFP